MSDQSIPTWQDRMPAPHQQKYCTMNCGPHKGDKRSRAQRMEDCEDCDTITDHGDPIAARDAEITDLRAALSQRAPISDAEIHDVLCNAKLQIEYLHIKFSETETGNQAIAQIESILAAQGDMSAAIDRWRRRVEK